MAFTETRYTITFTDHTGHCQVSAAFATASSTKSGLSAALAPSSVDPGYFFSKHWKSGRPWSCSSWGMRFTSPPTHPTWPLNKMCRFEKLPQLSVDLFKHRLQIDLFYNHQNEAAPNLLDETPRLKILCIEATRMQPFWCLNGLNICTISLCQNNCPAHQATEPGTGNNWSLCCFFRFTSRSVDQLHASRRNPSNWYMAID